MRKAVGKHRGAVFARRACGRSGCGIAVRKGEARRRKTSATVTVIGICGSDLWMEGKSKCAARQLEARRRLNLRSDLAGIAICGEATRQAR